MQNLNEIIKYIKKYFLIMSKEMEKNITDNDNTQ